MVKCSSPDIERAAFIKAMKHLDCVEMPDAWGRPMFQHTHVEAMWSGWKARAALDAAATPSMRDALEPFADVYNGGEGFEGYHDGEQAYLTCGRVKHYGLTLGDFHRAAIAAHSSSGDVAQPSWLPDLQFLLDRLEEFDPGDDEPEREFHGHVAPAIARLRSAIASTESK